MWDTFDPIRLRYSGLSDKHGGLIGPPIQGWFTSRSGPLPGLFVISYCYPATCGPKGHGSNGGFFFPDSRFPRPQTAASQVGPPALLSFLVNHVMVYYVAHDSLQHAYVFRLRGSQDRDLASFIAVTRPANSNCVGGWLAFIASRTYP